MEYPITEIQFKYYGKHIELLVEETIKETDATKQESLTIHILRLMKSLYQEWNRDAIEEDTLLLHLNTLSGGKLKLDPEKIEKYKLLEGREKTHTRRRNDSSNSQRSNNNHRRYSKRKKSF